MTWFNIAMLVGNVVVCVVLYVSFRKSLEMRDKAVRFEIAAIMLYRSTFAPRVVRKDLKALADLVVDPARSRAAADMARRAYAREAEKRKGR